MHSFLEKLRFNKYVFQNSHKKQGYILLGTAMSKIFSKIYNIYIIFSQILKYFFSNIEMLCMNFDKKRISKKY